jgi:DNA-binding MarR family transcriptional regulator
MGPMTATRWLSRPEERDWRSFQLMQARLTAQLAHDLTIHSGLSYQDYVVLVALTDQPSGELRVFQLAAFLGWDKSRLSHQVARMARRGLVEKRRCQTDGRGATVVITGEGRRQIVEAAPSHVDAVRRLFVDPLTPRQREQVGRAARAVLEAVAAEQSRTCPDAAGTVA